jgi:carboxypeptidase C (cathepsin A)
MYGFLSQQWVQKALGVPVNYTKSSEAVSGAFTSLGDFVRPGSREAVSYLLDNGVKVAMMFGDRDFICNWIGGERISLAIDYSATQQFRDAGYSPISTTEGVGSMVRQRGNFSFSRVFQAGHECM